MKLPKEIAVSSVREVWGERRKLLLTLTDRERTDYDRLPTETRRAQWLAGRICAKLVVQRMTGTSFAQIEIGSSRQRAEFDAGMGHRGGRSHVAGENGTGRPFISIAGRPISGVWLSISHSGDIAVADVARTPIGIDVEIVEPRSRGFAELVLAGSDVDCEANLDPFELTRVWCRKEAYSKWLGTGLHIPFVDLEPPRELTVEGGFFRHDHHIMCWVRVRGVSTIVNAGRGRPQPDRVHGERGDSCWT